jgi:hypothetical protein
MVGNMIEDQCGEQMFKSTHNFAIWFRFLLATTEETLDTIHIHGGGSQSCFDAIVERAFSDEVETPWRF